jgi:hypothetical protein
MIQPCVLLLHSTAVALVHTRTVWVFRHAVMRTAAKFTAEAQAVAIQHMIQHACGAC